MTLTASTRVRVKGKNVKIERSADSGDKKATLRAIEEVGEEARRVRKAADVENRSGKNSFRKKKTPE